MGSQGRRVVLFEAPRCHHCATMRPRVEEVAAAHADVVFERVDVTRSPEQVRGLSILGTPTLVAWDGEVEVGRLIGSHGASAIEALFGDGEAASGDWALWLGAGLALGLIGMAAGPAWPLVAIGLALAGYGALRSRT